MTINTEELRVAARSIALNEPGQPLVRADVLAREAKEARAAKRKSAADEASKQEVLL